MLYNILIIAAIIERVWEHLLQLIGEEKINLQTKLLGSAVLSIAASISLQLDLLVALELSEGVTTAGVVLTGIAIGLGSNVIHDLLTIINALSGKIKNAGEGW
jgi:hypothetical protein